MESFFFQRSSVLIAFHPLPVKTSCLTAENFNETLLDLQGTQVSFWCRKIGAGSLYDLPSNWIDPGIADLHIVGI